MGTRLALILAVVMGFIAFIGMKSMVKEEKNKNEEKYQTVNILAVKTKIRPGQPDGSSCITEKNVTAIAVPQAYVVDGMIAYNDRARYYGKEVVRDVDANRPLLEDMLKDTNKVSLSRAMVSSAMRAVTIGVDQIKGVAGLIKPGDYVDVVGTFAVDDPGARRGGQGGGAVPAGWKGANDAGRVTKTVYILQAAPVIAVDNRTFEVDYSDARKSNYRTVTLQVSPDDALRLIDATDKGKIQLILRNRSDTAPAEFTRDKTSTAYNDKDSHQPLLSVDITNEIYKTKSKE